MERTWSGHRKSVVRDPQRNTAAQNFCSVNWLFTPISSLKCVAVQNPRRGLGEEQGPTGGSGVQSRRNAERQFCLRFCPRRQIALSTMQARYLAVIMVPALFVNAIAGFAPTIGHHGAATAATTSESHPLLLTEPHA